MIIGILSHRIFPVDDFIELRYGIVVFFNPIMRITQLIIIGIVPLPPFAFIGD